MLMICEKEPGETILQLITFHVKRIKDRRSGRKGRKETVNSCCSYFTNVVSFVIYICFASLTLFSVKLVKLNLNLSFILERNA